MAEPIFWIAAVLCLLAEAAILRSAFANRVDAHPGVVPHSSRASEIVWAVVPAIGLALLLAATWRAIH